MAAPGEGMHPTGTPSPAYAPLVQPGSALSRRETARYLPHLLLSEVRAVGQRRIKDARVLSLGATGIGAVALEYLVAAGVGVIAAVAAAEGAPPVGPAVDRLRGRNPYVRLAVHDEPLDPNRARKLFPQYDLVLDGAGNRTASYVADYACAMTDRPLLWAAPGRAAVCWAGRGPRLRDVEGGPAAAQAAGEARKAEETLPFGEEALWSGLGAALATEAIKLITGIGEPLLGRILIHDPLGMAYRTEELSAAPVPADPTAAAAGHPSEGLSPVELRALLDAGAPIDLIDVREPYEWPISSIPGARRVPLAQWLDGSALGSLRSGRRPVFYCRAGSRTREAVAAAHRAGWAEAVHLAGGVNAWVDQVDPGQPAY